MAIDALPVDLSDLDSIRALTEELGRRNERIDVLVLNAAVVPAEARHTPQGLPEMFVVNYFSSFLLVRELVDRGLLALATERTAAHDESRATAVAEGTPSSRAASDAETDRAAVRPRIVIVSSEAHRSGADLELDMIERFVPHSLGQAVARYGYYKLMLTTFACELDRQLNPAGKIRCAVHVLCPGAVNTRIAREVPPILRPLADAVLRLAFRDPFDADEPVVFLAASRRLEGQSGLYLHRMTRKPVDERASNAEAGRRLWAESERLRERMWPTRAAQSGVDIGAIGAAIAG
jgi:NAD(P)-dependent dehydrogenase (short-subunit alcohol dehydrogenase family)